MAYPKLPACECDNALLVAMPAECPKCTEKAVRLQALLDATKDVCSLCADGLAVIDYKHPSIGTCLAGGIHRRIKQEQRRD